MGATIRPLWRLRNVELVRRRTARAERARITLPDGARTTLHIARFEVGEWRARVVAFDRPQPLVRWCRSEGARNAIVGGFFLRSAGIPLGELRIDGEGIQSIPFDTPWCGIRACVQVEAGMPQIARRDQLPAVPAGDLLQAGPLLVADGVRAVSEGADVEGFSAGAGQFDSDITRGRYPRAALALDGSRMLAVTCDGRTVRDAGMTLTELADALIGLGATHALNLDGGGSAALIYGGRLRNRPREEHGVDLLDGRPVVTAIVFEMR